MATFTDAYLRTFGVWFGALSAVVLSLLIVALIAAYVFSRFDPDRGTK